MFSHRPSHVFRDDKGWRKTLVLLSVLTFIFPLTAFAENEAGSAAITKDAYVAYMERYIDWQYSIEEAIQQFERNGFIFSPEAEELIDCCNITLADDERMSIVVQQTLFDSIAGYMNICFTSDQYILRPITCLDVYSPYYRPGETYEQPVCFIGVEFAVGDSMGRYAQYEGLSADQKQFNIIALASAASRPGLPGGESDVLLTVTLHSFNGEEETVETLDFSFQIHVLENIDECYLREPMIHEDYNLIVSDLHMVITPLRVSIQPMGRRRLDASADCRYFWALFDQNGERILDWSSREDGAYLSEIPEPIYYVVYEMDESGRGTAVYLKRLVRDGHTWKNTGDGSLCSRKNPFLSKRSNESMQKSVA